MKQKIDPSNSSAPYRVVNLSCGEKIKLMDFIKEIEKNLNVKLKIKYLPMQPGDIKETLSSKQNIKKIIKYPKPKNYKIESKILSIGINLFIYNSSLSFYIISDHYNYLYQ